MLPSSGTSQIGAAFDSVTAAPALVAQAGGANTVSIAAADRFAGIGLHYAQAMENSAGATFYGAGAQQLRITLDM